jgi:hypothetical protein
MQGMKRSMVIAGTVALGVAGCAGEPEPVPMTQQQLDAFGAGMRIGTTVAEAVALAPAGMVGLIEVHIDPDLGPVERASYGAPPEELLDWVVIGYCGGTQSVPSIEVAAVARTQAEAADRSPGFHLQCDGPAEDPS